LRQEIFGTIAAFAERRYPGDADAVTRSVEVSWSETELTRLMIRHPQIALNALKILGRQLHETQDRVREVSTQSDERRVAHSLLRLARQFGRDSALGTTIELPLRRRDVADIAATTIYSVSRLLTGWEARGWLVTRDQN
jgi:CRP-like cAMP-binding protein